MNPPQRLTFRLIGALTCILIFQITPFAQKKTHSERAGALTAREQLELFSLPEAFTIELVASEEDGVIKPIDLTFDDAGRLWTQTARMYPLDPIADVQWQDLLALMEDEEKQRNHPAFRRALDLYQGKTPGTDQILILDQLYNKNRARVSVFADELAIPMSILPYKNGTYVAQGSELFFLEDTNLDGRADTRRRLFTGFGFTDTHTMAHTLIRGPGGWIYFSQGALNKGNVTSLINGSQLRMDYSKIGRFPLDGTGMELVCAGLNNIWGFQLRANGEWYVTEANDLGYSVVPAEPGTAFPGIGNERIRPYQPFLPALHEFRVGGTGISGLAFADDAAGSYPSRYNDVAFLANPITSSVNAVRIVRNPDGSVSAEHLEDLVRCKDDWFRPVNMEFGPDGCLYIADWYNKIVSHNELPTTHPDRDKTHGRIWRIRHKDQKVRVIPDFYAMPTQELVQHLSDPSLWAKRAVWHQISERPFSETQSLKDDLILIMGNPAADAITRIHALWCIESLGIYEKGWIQNVLESGLDALIREGIRSLVSFELDISTIARLVGPFVFHSNPQVRAQVLRTLEEVGRANAQTIEMLVKACRPELPGNEMGGSYERRFERYLARKALENYPDELLDYLEHCTFSEISPENMLWASQALPVGERQSLFFKYWPEIKTSKLSESDFVAVMSLTDNPQIYNALKAHLSSSDAPEDYIRYALSHQAEMVTAGISELISGPVRTLVESGNKSQENLAIKAISAFHIGGLDLAIMQLDKSLLDNESRALIIDIIGRSSEPQLDFLEGVVGDGSQDFSIRLSALLYMIQADQIRGIRMIDRYFPNIKDEKRKEMIRVFSSDVAGVETLLKLYQSGYLNSGLFDAAAVDRIVEISDSSTESLKLKRNFDQWTNPVVSMEKTVELERYMDIVRTVKGNEVRGLELFKTCLMCHRVGDEGQDLAPALDGSKYRTDEAVLTAILDPDAAVESGYSVYRVVKNNGSIVEGLLVEKNDSGTTIGFIGGSKTFIPKTDIESESFLTGKSFMPKGLIDSFTDQQVADLLAFIRSLN